MAKRHLRYREPGWRLGLLVNGAGAVATVRCVLGVIVRARSSCTARGRDRVLVPVLVWLLVRMNKQYDRETTGAGAGGATFTPTLDARPPITVLLCR